MRVYEVTVIDRCAGVEPVSYESYVVVDDENDGTKATDWELFYQDLKQETGLTDEDVHYYFTKDEFKPVNGEIETEKFRYIIGKKLGE